jgi:peptidoglycan/xylan/chitin deacetylase (PgdA/CDA1 family)
MENPRQNKAVITTSWDDGHPLDLKLAEMLQKYNLPATFYVPTKNVERECMNPKQVAEIAQNFEIGGHTSHHFDLTRLPLHEAKREIIESKQEIENITGKELLSFCPPKAKINAEIIKVVKEAGFAISRTARLFTRRIKDPFKIGTTVHVQDHWVVPYINEAIMSRDKDMLRFLVRHNLFFKRWDQIAIYTLNFVIEHGGIWHLWGHSWEIEENNNWERLEKVLRITSAISKEAKKGDNSHLIEYCNHEFTP